MQVPFLDLKTQYRQIEGELKPILEEIMANGAFIGGPQVSAFEASA
jgi:UDP-2-acetamido-2-deoxy-ribo-hexuluronate aminotransferase